MVKNEVSFGSSWLRRGIGNGEVLRTCQAWYLNYLLWPCENLAHEDGSSRGVLAN